MSQHPHSHPSKWVPRGHRGRQTANMAKMADKCINCMSAPPTPPIQTLWSRDRETLFRLKIAKNQKIHDLRPKKRGGHFLTPPPPPTPPPPSLKFSKKWVSSGGGSGGGVRTKNSLGEVFIGQNNDFTRG